MKAASVSEVKNALLEISQPRLVELCVKLAKFKKENKELLTYLLFEATDEEAYIQQVKNEIEYQFGEINYTHIYFAKKSIRKILRITNKYCKYTGSKQAEAALLIYFCNCLKKSPIAINKSTALQNLYTSQLLKIEKIISMLHEDLQYDFKKMIEVL